MLLDRETCKSLLAVPERYLIWAKILCTFEQEVVAIKGALASVVGRLTGEPNQSLLDGLDRSIARRGLVVVFVVVVVDGGGGAPKIAAVVIRERIAVTGRDAELLERAV
jgi:hypothetical protein